MLKDGYMVIVDVRWHHYTEARMTDTNGDNHPSLSYTFYSSFSHLHVFYRGPCSIYYRRKYELSSLMIPSE